LANLNHHILGRELAESEATQLQNVLVNMPGQYLLQLGNIDSLNAVKTPRIVHRIMLSPDAEKCKGNSSIHSQYQELPLGNESINIVLLSHVLEFAMTPSSILTEAWRVLAPDGHLIILSFNPWSPWGVRHFTQLHGAEKWCRQIKHMAGKIIQTKYFFFYPQSCWLDKTIQLLFPALGGVYILVAKKTTLPLTPIRSRWSWQDLLVSQKTLEPTTRGVRRG
jgi:SAM-dependent methyltransferase